MQDAFAYCQELVRETDKDRFLATLFASAEQRRHLFALYAFNGEIAQVRERAGDPLAGELRLQWWRDAIDGTRSQEARAHPVAAGLLAAMAERQLPVATLVALIDARTFDLYDEPMASLAELEEYAERTSSALCELAMRIVGTEVRPDLAGPAGIAYAITGLLRSFALHVSRRQLFVPIDVLERHGARLDDVFAGRASPNLHAALAELRQHARRHLDAFVERAAGAAAEALTALLPAALVRGYLDRMERHDYEPFASVVDVPQWRRQWVLWRAARGARVTTRPRA
jgi:phytoene synthase